MLTAYLNATNALLQQPPATAGLYSTGLLTQFINTARGQVAGESEAIRLIGGLSITSAASPQAYPFSSITLGGVAGVAGVINVRTIWYPSGSGRLWVAPETFEWFSIYELNNAAPAAGPPVVWSQFGQGASAQTSPLPVGGGSVYISPGPDQTYALTLDCVGYPIPLADDTTAEALPYLWTDAVPYFAAYLALLSAQTGMRTQQADAMFKLYELFVQRARKAATSSVLPWQFEQTQAPGGINAAPQQTAG